VPRRWGMELVMGGRWGRELIDEGEREKGEGEKACILWVGCCLEG
jgi:hypothetical protein